VLWRPALGVNYNENMLSQGGSDWTMFQRVVGLASEAAAAWEKEPLESLPTRARLC